MKGYRGSLKLIAQSPWWFLCLCLACSFSLSRRSQKLHSTPKRKAPMT